MASAHAPNGLLAISTSVALIGQFLAGLAPDARHDIPTTDATTPSPLVLLEAAVKSLRAQVTKLSLLTMNAPFTPFAVSASLKAVNESILPSLMTATLLIIPESFTPSFAKEVKGLARVLLRELLSLIRLVEVRSRDENSKVELAKARKNEVTEATGRVWEACDTVATLSEQGLPAFVVRKAKQWLDLMKDAVKELQDWDPEDDIDDDNIFEDTESNGNEAEPDATSEDDHKATISAGVRDQAMKVLSRIPQSIHVVIKQRLEKVQASPGGTLESTTRKKLEDILSGTRRISDLIDEAAEGVYMGDPELCLKKSGEARALTIEIVELVLDPISNTQSEPDRMTTQEDKYIKRALEWVRQVDTANKSTP